MRRVLILSLAVGLAAVVAAVWFAVAPSHVSTPEGSSSVNAATSNSNPLKANVRPGLQDAGRSPDVNGGVSDALRPEDTYQIQVSVDWTDSLDLPAFKPSGVWARLDRGDARVQMQSMEGSEAGKQVPKASFSKIIEGDGLWRLWVDADFVWDGGSSEVEIELDQIQPSGLDDHTCSFRVALDTADFPDGHTLVRGRVTHASGASLANERFRVFSPQYLSEQDQATVTVGSDGSFATLIDVQRPSAPEKGNPCAAWSWGVEQSLEDWQAALRSKPWGVRHTIRSSYRYEGRTPLVTAVPVKAEGRWIDLGEFEYDCAMLEIVTEGEPQVRSLESRFRMGETELQFWMHAAAFPWRLLLSSGRVFYELDPMVDGDSLADETAQAYDELVLSGHCDLDDGKCTKLKLAMPELEFVDVRVFSDEGVLEEARVSASWDELSDLHHGPVIGGDNSQPPGRVLCTGRQNLRLYVYADGYEPQRIAVPKDVRALEVRLKKVPPGPEPETGKQGIEVRLNLPDSFEGWFRIIAFDEAGNPSDAWATLTAEDGVAVLECPPGLWAVGVFGGALMGYPGGMISGLVKAEVFKDRVTRVRLPAPLPPPFEKHRDAKLSFTCGQAALDLRVPMRMPSSRASADTRPREDGDWPVALIDTTREIPLRFTEDGYESGLELGADLPIRVEVTVRGESLDGWAWIQSGIELSAGARLVNNVANLWLPTGPAHLEVSSGTSTFFSTDLDVPASGTLEVVVSNTLGTAIFNLPPGVDHWELLRPVEGGHHVVDFVYESRTEQLAPGDYRLVAVDTRFESQCEFQIRAGCEITVEPEPQKEFLRADVFLPLPVEYGEQAVEGQFEFAAADLIDQLVTRSGVHHSMDISYHYGVGGLVLEDVPLGREIFLWGWAGRGERDYTLLPDRLVVNAGTLRIPKPRWAAMRGLSREWELPKCSIQWAAQGCRLYGEHLRLPVGAITLYIHNGEATEEFDLTVPSGDGEFEIPQQLRRRLIELGWLKSG